MSDTRHWLGSEGVAWNILLVAHLERVPSMEVLRDRLATLSAAEGWPTPSGADVGEGAESDLLASYAAWNGPHPVSVARTPTGLVVRAHHAYVDGLGMLAVLRELALPDLVSGATGLTERGHRSLLGTVASRLAEVVFRPPAKVPGAPDGGGGEVFATTDLDQKVHTAALVHAGAAAVQKKRVAVAVGVSRTGGADLRVGDHSGFLRLTDVDRLDLPDIELALATAPLQLGGTAPTGATRRLSGAIRWGSTRFDSRLGSTLLVSHLGRVTADGLGGAAFHPLSGSGSGVSLGAVTVADRTTLTVRARGTTHSTVDVEELLARVVSRL